ncbi:MAG: hypothetical protein ACFFCS_20470 [Candidatus Hodarchaeota archaeon]
MGKDKIIGAVLLAACAAILGLYTYGLWIDFAHYKLDLNPGTIPWSWFETWPGLFFSWEIAIILPVYLAIVVVLIIGIWIGYSMLTTPPPVPLEELEEELEAEEAEAAKEKKE